ncbi:MAG: AAA family ATPase [Sandaracinaceae bacterium]|nr:AAA family ATPase [Sandaracinaceae bacterium]
MTDATPEQAHRRRLRAHFGFSNTPFHKAMKAALMYDSTSQRELLAGLDMWLEVGGIACVSGASGVGKSITLRRFVAGLDTRRYHLVQFSYLPGTVPGFLRSMSRALGLQMRLHGADLFDAARDHLASFEAANGPHPVVLIDDAEGLSAPVLDAIRRLTTHDLDGEQRFSVLLAGTDDITRTLRASSLESLRSRIAYAHALRPFTLEDTRNYLRFHLQRADVDAALISDDAARRIFVASRGRPRHINQLALHGLIAAAASGRDDIDGKFMQQQIEDHPLYRGKTRDAPT